MARNDTRTTTRRDLLQWTAAAATAATVGNPARAAAPASGPGDREAQILGDRFWVWTHAEGSYKRDYGLPRASRMTPVEALKFEK